MDLPLQGRHEPRFRPWLPLTAALAALLAWTLATIATPGFALPPPGAVASAFGAELTSGRLLRDTAASLVRVGAGFGAAAALAVPIGVWLGHAASARQALMPLVNFLRCLSPLAWIPFAILWFGIGDMPAMFLIFIASFFPLLTATTAAVAEIPAVYFKVARDHRLAGPALWRAVTLPAALPRIITALRMTAGVAWMVVVAAEMIAGRDGLGFAIWDARNGLRTDLLVVGMIAIGSIGLGLDRALHQLSRLPGVRWAYEG